MDGRTDRWMDPIAGLRQRDTHNPLDSHSHLWANLEWPVNLTVNLTFCMSLDYGRKQERTRADMGRTCILQAKYGGLEPITFLLWGKSANSYTTVMQPSYLAKILQHFHKVFYSSPFFLVLMALVVPQWQPHMYPWESTTHSGRGPACVAKWMWAVGGMWEWEGGGHSCDLQMDDRKDFVLSGWQRQAWRQSSLFKLCRDEMSLMAAQPGLTSLSLNVIWTQSHCATLAATWLWRQI